MLTLFAMIATPLFGLMVDRVGKRAILMMFGSMLLIPVYLMMAYTRMSILYVPMAMMGVAFSLIPAVMWPSVAYIVDQSQAGHRLRADDHDPEHWSVRLQPADRLGERLSAMPAPRTRPATIWGCGFSRFWGSWVCFSRSCYVREKLAPMVTG